MKPYNMLKRAFAAAAAAVICLALILQSAAALSLDGEGSITLSSFDTESGEAVGREVFRIYRIAHACVDGDGISYTYTADFEACGIGVENMFGENSPVHFMVHASINEIPYREKVSDDLGKTVFDGLELGVYLVVPVVRGTRFIADPFIVSVPIEDEVRGELIYDVDAAPKFVSRRSGSDICIDVKKQWQSGEETPESVKVLLIRDGEIYDFVILSEENQWCHRWENLEGDYVWRVAETNVPEGYTVTYATTQSSVLITNTETDYEQGADTSDETDESAPSEGLVQTGQLNWPVPVLSICGLVLFSIGWALLNFKNKDENLR